MGAQTGSLLQFLESLYPEDGLHWFSLIWNEHNVLLFECFMCGMLLIHYL
jgi:hypothetical protein